MLCTSAVISRQVRGVQSPGGSRWRIHSVAHVVRIVSCGIQDQISKLRVLFHERRHKRVEESEGVIADQHLAITIRSRADADRRNTQPGSYGLGDGIWNRLDGGKITKRGSREESAFLELVRTTDILSRRVSQTLKKEELSETQYNVLRILRGAPAGLSCGEIGNRMITRDPDITRLLHRLEKRD